jgi:ankyrin repeat protein
MARLLQRVTVAAVLLTACQLRHEPSPPSPSPARTSAQASALTKPNWNRRLLQAAENSEYEVALVALQHGASPNARGFFKMSPLLWAVSKHNLPLVKLLLDYDADPNQAKKDDVTPIFLATVFPPPDVDDLSIADLLVERGADVNRRSDTQDTPMIWVAFYGHVPIAKFLLQHGATEASRRHDFISYQPGSNKTIECRLTIATLFSLRHAAATVLILFAAAAGTRFVTADFWYRTTNW